MAGRRFFRRRDAGHDPDQLRDLQHGGRNERVSGDAARGLLSRRMSEPGKRSGKTSMYFRRLSDAGPNGRILFLLFV